MKRICGCCKYNSPESIDFEGVFGSGQSFGVRFKSGFEISFSNRYMDSNPNAWIQIMPYSQTLTQQVRGREIIINNYLTNEERRNPYIWKTTTNPLVNIRDLYHGNEYHFISDFYDRESSKIFNKRLQYTIYVDDNWSFHIKGTGIDY